MTMDVKLTVFLSAYKEGSVETGTTALVLRYGSSLERYSQSVIWLLGTPTGISVPLVLRQISLLNPVSTKAQKHRLGLYLMSKKQKVLAECQARVSRHEFQAAHAEEEQRLLQGLLWQQKLEFREAHRRGLTEMEELRKFQSSAFDTGKTKIHRGSEHFFGTFWPSTGIAK